MDNFKTKLNIKRLGIKNYLQTTALKSNKHALDRFWFNRWLLPYQKEIARNKRIKSNSPIISLPTDVASQWIEQDLSDMEWPLLHIYGETGTGKSHFCRGFIRYILLNKFDYDQPYPTSVEYFDWHNYVQKTRNGWNGGNETRELNWQAEIMLIEDIDRQACISREGSTFSLELLVAPLKQRLEVDRLPTVFISHRDATKLTKFLATDITSKFHKTAEQMARDVGNLIGNTMFAGESRGTDFRAEIRGNKQYYDKVITEGLKTQNLSDIFDLRGNYGMEVEW